MIKLVKDERGITLITLVIMVLLMAIITGMMGTQSKTSLQLSNLTKLQNDIEALNDRIAVYYVQNGDIPKLDPENTAFQVQKSKLEEVMKLKFKEVMNNSSDFEVRMEDLNNTDDGEIYYTINLSKLDNLSLNYGAGYKSSSSGDRYIINEKTHRIYYLRGALYNGIVYHTADM